MHYNSLVLDVAVYTLPTILSACRFTSSDLVQVNFRQFLSNSLDKNHSFLPEVVMGAVFSAINKAVQAYPKPETLTWPLLRSLIIPNLVNLKRSPDKNEAYSNLFFHLSVGLACENLSAALLERYCSYLAFDGSIRHSDESYASFYDYLSVENADLRNPDNTQLYADIPVAFKVAYTNKVISLYSHSLELSAHAIGRSANRLDTLTSIMKIRDYLREPVSATTDEIAKIFEHECSLVRGLEILTTNTVAWVTRA